MSEANDSDGEMRREEHLDDGVRGEIVEVWGSIAGEGERRIGFASDDETRRSLGNGIAAGGEGLGAVANGVDGLDALSPGAVSWL